MQQTIPHGADGGDVAEQFSPVLDRTVGSKQCAEALVAAHNDFQQVLGGCVREFAHAEVINNEQRHGGHRLRVLFACAVGDGVGQFIQQDVRFAIQHFVALLDGALADGLRQVALAEALTLQRRFLRVADAGFDLAFSVRVSHPARQSDRAVMLQHVAVKRIERGIVNVGA